MPKQICHLSLDRFCWFFSFSFPPPLSSKNMSQCSISQSYLPESESKYTNSKRPALALVSVGTDAVVSAFYDTRPLLFMRSPEVVVVGSLLRYNLVETRYCLIAKETRSRNESKFLDLEVVYKNVMRVTFSTLSGQEVRLPCMFSCTIDLETHFHLFSSRKYSLYVALVVRYASMDTWVKVCLFLSELNFACCLYVE